MPDVDDDEDMDDENAADAGSSDSQMVKNLVRMALACEHSRTPLRRSDINVRCLNGRSRQFKNVLSGAQLALRQTFGMDLVELPAKEKITLAQRRAAQKSQNTQSNSANKQYILVSRLPEKYRDPSIIPPSRVPDDDIEANYMAFYGMVVSFIAIYGSAIPERLLERCCARMHASEMTPVDRFDRTIDRMVKHGYIAKLKEISGGEETIEYIVGPRGKREVALDGIAGFVRAVYGFDADANQVRDMEKKLEQSLKMANMDMADNQSAEGGEQAGGAAPGRQRRRSTRRSQVHGDEAEQEEDEDE